MYALCCVDVGADVIISIIRIDSWLLCCVTGMFYCELCYIVIV